MSLPLLALAVAVIGASLVLALGLCRAADDGSEEEDEHRCGPLCPSCGDPRDTSAVAS